MYVDDQALRQFKMMHARDMMALDAHHIDEATAADGMSAHFRARRRDKAVLSILVVAVTVAAAYLALTIAGLI